MMHDTPNLPFDNSYARLPERFYAHRQPTPVAQPQLIRANRALAQFLGIDPDWLASADGVAVVAGNRVPAGAAPIATVYAGHQFGSWNPRLGDGRAILLGEVIAADGERYDIQLKGAGPTPFSRMGDGRSPLGPVLREYIVSEAMYAMGVPTTRALAAVTTGEAVYRDTVLPGAVLARVARSHIRVGTVQYFASRQDSEGLRLLVDHVIARHYPEAAGAPNPTLAMLQGIIRRQAALVAQWQLLGFIHGVMNTDNMLLSGETVDYGPCAFMDTFDPATVYSSIDHGGRYAYRNQPAIAQWNLANLANALLPILDDDEERAVTLAQAAVDEFAPLFVRAHEQGLLRKLGLTAVPPDDDSLPADLLQLMQDHRLDFTLTFRRLADLTRRDRSAQDIGELFELPQACDDWLARWRRALSADPVDEAQRQAQMYAANPVFIPRNHLVEEAIAAATAHNDFAPFHQLVDVLEKPFDFRTGLARYALPPKPGEEVTQTFCGT